MKYDVKAIQIASKQRYIDLGIYVEGCDISSKSIETQKQATRSVNINVVAGKLPHISTLKCTDCGNQARHYHHNISYREEHWLCVIPLCVSCHNSLHNKIENDLFYNFGAKQSIQNYLKDDINIHLNTLAMLNGVSEQLIKIVCSQNNITNRFKEQFYTKLRGGTRKPTKKEMERLYADFGNVTKVAKELGVHYSTAKSWLVDYNIHIDACNVSKNKLLRCTDNDMLGYIQKGNTINEIGNILHVASTTIGRWIAELPKDKLAQAMGNEKYNKNIHTQVKQTKIRLKKQRYKQSYIDSVVLEMEQELIH